MVNEKPKVSIVIVSWNTRRLTTECIASVYDKNKKAPFETIVVDNASSDDSVFWIQKEFPQVAIIRNDKNTGFAHANNQAIREAKGDIVLMLNSDTALISNEILQTLVDYFSAHPETAVLGAKLLLPDGSIQSIGRKFWSLKRCIQVHLLFISGQFWLSKRTIPRTVEADYVDGAFLAFPKKVVDKIGLLDESFFMYAEDMEFCARIRRAGYKVVVLTDIEVIHYHAASSRQNFAEMLLESAKNISRFINIHEGPFQAKAAFVVQTIGMALRLPISLVRKPALVHAYWSGFRKCVALWWDLDSIFQDSL